MANRIQIEVDIDSSGAVSGLKNVTDAVDKIPAHAAPAFQQMTRGQREARDAAEALSYTFGVNLPAAVTRVISKMPGLASALGTIGKSAGVTALVVGLAEAATHIDEIQQKLVSLGTALADAGQRFGNLLTGNGFTAGSLGQKSQRDTITAALDPFTSQVGNLVAAAQAAGKEGAAAIEAQANIQIEALKEARQKLLDEAAKQFGLGSSVYAQIDQDSLNGLNGLVAGEEAIERRKQQDLLKLRRDTVEQSLQMQEQADEAGLTGFQLLLKQEADSIRKQNAELQKNGLTFAIAPDDAAIRAKTDNAIAQQGKQWKEEIDSLTDQLSQAGVSGFDAIDRKVGAQQAKLIQEFNDKYGAINPFPDPQGPEEQKREQAWLDAAGNLNRGLTAIWQEGERQRALAMRQADDQVLDAESKAAIAALPEWQRGNAQIIADFQDRQRQINEMLDDGTIVNSQAIQLQESAYSQMNSELIDQARQTRDELAGQIESVFDDITSGNIGQAILGQIKHFFAEIVAQWILSMTQMKAASATGLGSFFGGSGGGGILGSLFGGLFGGGSGGSMTTPPFLPAPAGGGSGLFSGMSNPFGMAASGGLAAGLASPFALSNISGLSAGAGTATLAAQQHAQAQFANTIGGSILENGLGKVLTHGLSLGKFSLGGPQTGLLGAGIGLTSIMAAYSSANPLLGGIGGAGGGALLGFSYGGPWGALAGAAIGGLAGVLGGLFGKQHRENEAIDLLNQVTPAIAQIVTQYKQFQEDYQSATSALNDLQNQTKDQFHQLGSVGDDYYKKFALPEITDAENSIDTIEKERERRGALVFAPAQFASGGTVPGFGPVPVIAHGREEIIREPFASQNRDLLKYINAGGTVPGFGPSSTSRTTSQNIVINISTTDAKSFIEYIQSGKIARAIRQAIRLDQLDYAGGSSV